MHKLSRLTRTGILAYGRRDAIVKSFFYAFPIIAVISPTGAIAGFDVKLVLLLLMILLSFRYFLHPYIFLFFGILILISSYSVFLGNDISNVFQHFLSITMWIIASFSGIAILQWRGKAEEIIIAVLYALSVYAAAKVIFILLYVSGRFDFWSMILLVEKLTGHRFPAWEGNGFRMTASNENLVVFYPLFFAYLKQRNRISTTLAIISTIASIVILFSSNSRLLYIVFLLNAVIYGRNRYFRYLFLPTVVIGFSAKILDRFSNENAQLSDSTRVRMLEHLIEGIRSAPMFGNGIGWYSPSFIRFEGRPWLYELQVLSTVSQLGIFGAIIFLTSIIFIMRSFKLPWHSYFIFFCLLFMSIFNSFMFTVSSAAAMMIAFSMSPIAKKGK